MADFDRTKAQLNSEVQVLWNRPAEYGQGQQKASPRESGEHVLKFIAPSLLGVYILHNHRFLMSTTHSAACPVMTATGIDLVIN